MKRHVLACLVVVMATVLVATTAFAQAKPEFQLGFKALADQIPAIAGEPTESEHWGANGDSLQTTTTGLMAWRKADNHTLFTDGNRSWVNGPQGLQSRLNSDRFEWEGVVSEVGSSRLNPVPVGQLGTYTDSQGRIFEMTVLEVQRNAYADLKAKGLISSVTAPPKPGMDFMMVQVRLHYVLGDPKESYRAGATTAQIVAQNKLWRPDSFTQIKPFISQPIFPGATIDGWFGPFEIPTEAMNDALLNYEKLWLALK